jgi:GNAT superfamily N-acetyltransferase
MRIRELSVSETSLARALLERMDTGDLLHHFQCAMTGEQFDLWEERARSHRLIGSFDGSRLVGLAEVAERDDTAECSLWVDAGHRRRGIGTALFERACDVAREGGARSLVVLVTRGDADMLDMAARHDGLSVYRHGGSLILPDGDHSTARWLVFELADAPPKTWLGKAVRFVRGSLNPPEPEHR